MNEQVKLDRYQVKFRWNGETRYGIVESYCDEAKAAAKTGYLIIEDAITPERYRVADNADVIDIPIGGPKWENNVEVRDEYHAHMEAEFDRAQKLSDSLPIQPCVGKLISMGVGDGSAYYVITKVSKSTCTLEWRGFSADRWVDRMFGYGGSFRIQDVALYIHKPWNQL